MGRTAFEPSRTARSERKRRSETSLLLGEGAFQEVTEAPYRLGEEGISLGHGEQSERKGKGITD